MGHPDPHARIMTAPARFTLHQADAVQVFSFSGELNAMAIADVWMPACAAIKTSTDPVTLDMSQLDQFDIAGAAFVAHLERVARADHPRRHVTITGLGADAMGLLSRLRESGSAANESPVKPHGFVQARGQAAWELWNDIYIFIAFVGEICHAACHGLRHPGQIRWTDTFRVAERSGVDALPIVALISFIVGLVMAFQSAIPMRMFGAEIYVANLIGIAMVRELGPLMTAIVLAGRSASAFAAEIGTMKINEEIDALTVMGLDPVRFLILPRIIASTVVTPLLTVFANLVGILGGAVVILSLDYPIITYYNQVVGFVTWQDFTGGIVKCFVFGILIAATGCIRGYQTQRGPSAVGESTTRAVVTSIVLIAVADGIFSVVYYVLGI